MDEDGDVGQNDDMGADPATTDVRAQAFDLLEDAAEPDSSGGGTGSARQRMLTDWMMRTEPSGGRPVSR